MQGKNKRNTVGEVNLFFNRKDLDELLNGSKDSIFGQSWNDKILYLGSRVAETPNKGYIFVEFYKQIGTLGFFK